MLLPSSSVPLELRIDEPVSFAGLGVWPVPLLRSVCRHDCSRAVQRGGPLLGRKPLDDHASHRGWM